MQMVPINSDVFTAVGYDTYRKLLQVTLKNGVTYEHTGVPESTYNELIAAKSKGKYYASNIKRIYAHRRID